MGTTSNTPRGTPERATPAADAAAAGTEPGAAAANAVAAAAALAGGEGSSAPLTPELMLNTNKGHSSTADMDPGRPTMGSLGRLTDDPMERDRSDFAAMLDVDLQPEMKVVKEVDEAEWELTHKKMMAFNEDMMEVMVLDTNEAGAEAVVQVGVNGLNQFFPRGEIVRCKRKFVEGLARAKPQAIRTPTNDQNPHDTTNRVVRHRALAYPFNVVFDPRGRLGAQWLKAVLAQP